MNSHLDDDNLDPRPENLELRSAQIPITTIKGLCITLAAAVFAVVIYYLLPYEEQGVKLGLALLAFIAVMWLTEAVHITVTALMVPVLAVLLHIPTGVNDKGQTTYISFKSTLASFADPTIYIFFGGFALAGALHMQRLDRKIANAMVKLGGGDLFLATILMFAVTAALSMWISNTATAAMMLPLAIGMLDQVDREKNRNTFVFVLLGIAYCASIGGLGTMVGSPPNLIAAKQLGYDFGDWMKIGLPMVILLIIPMIMILYFVLKPNFSVSSSDENGSGMNKNMPTESIPWTYHRIVTVVIFAVTALLWMFSTQINKGFELGSFKFAGLGYDSFDSIIAVSAAVAVVLFGAVSWKEVAQNTDWGVLLMFGGGLALSGVLKNSGASAALGNTVADLLNGASPVLIIFVVATFIIFLTEFTSNTASAALMVPVFAEIAGKMGMPPETVVLVIGIGASCAFMMPVATPPNAIVFGTGLIKQREMIKVGFILNVVSVILVAGYICLTELLGK